MFKERSMNIVKKVWGEEHWLVNDDFCCKELILEEDYRCSLHFHKNKDELFYVISGKILLEIDGESKVLLAGDWERVKPYQQHRFTGLIESVILEASTHHEDEDSYRLSESGKVQ
jgi:mannose-6-phosphate isomerase-like protein (cupin superfamily)